ncbi:hypothetical protein [Modestobacter sp. NPDC049651]|uniref:hypothetical protein n=1 Tax=unclassified Modestobacter TaxID=2643866 RepID=UPI0033D0D78A
MTVAAVVLLAVLVVTGLSATLAGERLRSPLPAVLLVVLLALAAAAAWRAGRPADGLADAGRLLAVAVAALAGGPVTTAVLRAADPDRGPSRRRASDPEVLRGGAWIGVLERTALAATLLAGWPEGLAVLIAVKGLGRFNELKAPVAAERFIIGTLASALWAVGCVGVAVLLRS